MKTRRHRESPWGWHAGAPRSMDEQAHEAGRIAEQIKPLLAGWPPQVQSAILAELLAIWLAGHVDLGSRDMTTQLRAALLDDHLVLVDELVPVVAKGMGLPW
jgi:hypothetical protein